MRTLRELRRGFRRVPLRVRAAMARYVRPRGDAGIRVSYGFARLPAALHGGLVKVHRLHATFPNHPWRFNVVYLVSSHLPPGVHALLPLVRSGRVALVWNQNGVAYPAWHGPGWERVNADMASLLAAATHVVYQSRFCQMSADRFLGHASRTSEILYNAVDTTCFRPAPPRTTAAPLTILVGGTQDIVDRVAVALRVLARVVRRCPTTRMIITGTLRWGRGPAEAAAETRTMVRDLGLEDHVECTGPYTQADAPSLYTRADLLLHCKYNDPSPGVVVEALACGLPVVYSATGGLPEIVGEAGIGVPSELSWERNLQPDVDSMAEAVFEVAARRNQLSALARRRAIECFDLKPWLDRHAAIFAEVVERRRLGA
jgi:glycosyltransferase involved in cell wall biosynthesis